MRALVLDGGGMRSAYTAGVLAGLRAGGIDRSFFDVYVGSSGGACAMSYFLTDQVEEGLRCWKEHLPGNFMTWRGGKPTNNSAYLEKLFREIEPISTQDLISRREKAVVALTNPATMRIEYKMLNHSYDPICTLIAGTTMPFFSPPAELDGQFYYDANVTCAIPLRYTDMIEASETWVVLTTPAGYRRKKWRWQCASWFVGDRRAGKLLRNRPRVENIVLEEIENRKELVVIRPEQPLPVHWRNDDKKAIAHTIEIGMQSARKLLENQ